MHAIKQESRRSSSSQSQTQSSTQEEDSEGDAQDTPAESLTNWAHALVTKADLQEHWMFPSWPGSKTVAWEKRSFQSPDRAVTPERPTQSTTAKSQRHHQQREQQQQQQQRSQSQSQSQSSQSSRRPSAELPLIWAAPSSTFIQRQRLMDRFMDLYLFQPKPTSKQFTFLAGLATVPLKVPVLLAAIDALCLAGLGSAYNDTRCIQASRQKYCNALTLLAPHVGRSPYNYKYQKEVFTSIVLLSFCEHFAAIAPAASCPRERFEPRISHLRGAESWLRACGPSIVTTAGGCSSNMMLQIMMVRNQSWLLALAERKACLFAQPQWRQLTRSLAQMDGQSVLYDILLPLPGLMEEADASMHSSNRLRYLYRRVSDLRKELDAWQAEQPPYELRDSRDMPTLTSAGAAHTFLTTYAFASRRAIFDYGLCWLFALLVNCTQLRILHHHPLSSKKRAGGFEAIADVQRDIFVLSTHFCRMVPAWLEDANAIISSSIVGAADSDLSGYDNASLAIWAFRFVVGYYEEYGMMRELEWCRKVQRLIDPVQEEGCAITDEQQQQQDPQAQASQSGDMLACYNAWPPWQFYKDAAWPARLAP